MALTVTIVIAVILCSLTVLLSYRYVRKAFDSMDAVLDSVLARNAELPFEAAADSRLSKLTHKAVKIIQMNTLDISQTTQEKEIIQSFISDMSHQMKTPLSGVAMYTDLLLEGRTTEPERQEFLSRIKTGTEKLQWMMDSLVKMSRLEVGAIELSPVPAGIKQTITDSISAVYGAAAKRNISIQTAYFEDTLLLHDRKWTGEAITNILENAIKYSPPGGEIKLSVEALPIYTKINITDCGIGIAPDEWNSIFKRFYRGRNAKDVDGAGLGLYLASLIFQKQSGYILVDSRPGKYTTFSMFLQNCKK
ncbi:histidine kinase [Syntrophobotulus glycolicus DSM 8271]|uniref:histidine kinase n=1 Tax=Syntrophobotulus glycolicus (strain DSM 8271 / FlGlyR) TaxID=645991 RepID=F0SV61_SYNGF|nr:HAMP domain-containing sensor histidine kinase [Syntrophobotulus glycolicus]ADY55561.1 histidine kinase [Syntrophobotulus glycolicus DSM 8271]